MAVTKISGCYFIIENNYYVEILEVFMGLLTKEIEIVMAGSNPKYYESLGYTIPKYRNKYGQYKIKQGTKILVKIEDVKKKSNCRVDVECNNCKRRYTLSYDTYNKESKNGKILCYHCMPKFLHGGSKSHFWKSELSDEDRQKLRHTDGYLDFIKKTLKRDQYTCQCCGSKENLEAHHLDGYNWCHEKREDETNSITLCKNCHSNFHSTYGYGNNTKAQFEEWLGKSVDNLSKYEGVLSSCKKIYNYQLKKTYANTKECFEELNYINDSPVYAVCNSFRKYISDLNTDKNKFLRSAKGFNLFWEDDYLKYKDTLIVKYLQEYEKLVMNKYPAIVCLNNKRIYKNAKDVKDKINCASTAQVYSCCRGEQRYVGRDDNGIPLLWMFHEDYLKLTDEIDDYDAYLESKIKEALKRNRDASIICLDTLKVFDKIIYASNFYNMKSYVGISRCCSCTNQKTAGKYNGKPLRWMYYSDYLELIEKGVNIDEYYTKTHTY